MMPQTIVGHPEIAATVERLMSGDVFTALAMNGAERRTAALEVVLQAVVDDTTRVIWVGNPLRSPLTIERFLIQIIGPEVDLRIERGPGELAGLIARREGSESRVLVIVQQPETINPETIEQLGAMAGHLGGEAVQLQFLFVGSPALRLPNVAIADLSPPSPPKIAAVVLGARTFSSTRFEAGDWTVGAAPRRRGLLPLLCLLLIVFLGAVFSFAPPVRQVALPKLVAAVPGPPGAVAGPIDQLRAHFDAFLVDRVPALPPLTDAQKDALFGEFLTHHRRE